MFGFKLFFCFIHIGLSITLTKSEFSCLTSSIISCRCNSDESLVTCIENRPSNETFIDWSTFSSSGHRFHLFKFINFTHLTSNTFTNFTSTVLSLGQFEFTFINRIDRVEENTFQILNFYSDTPITLIFESPRNFQLANYAFSRLKYREIVISDIQNDNPPYQLNLKAFDNTQIYQMSISDSPEFHFISNGSSLINITHMKLKNCSLTNIDLLLDSLSTFMLDIDLSSNKLNHIPSFMKLSTLKDIDLSANLFEDVKSNIFTNLTQLNRINLSHNQIKHIAPDAFLGLTQLSTLVLYDNRLTSLETITVHNEVISFLYPLVQTLTTLHLSNNFLHDFKAIRNLSSLNSLQICCNKIKTLDENAFKNVRKLETIDLSSNHIESIHPMAFDGTILIHLDLSSNSFSSLETTKHVIDDHFYSKNQTSSFLDTIQSTLIVLSLENCTNLLELNWFVLIKLRQLTILKLSGTPKTDKFWTLESRDGSIIDWHGPSFDHRVSLNDIRFDNNDYCLSKPIFQIFNRTTIQVDENHPCNCFIFMMKKKFGAGHHPICLSNQSIVQELTHECVNIDLSCLSLVNSTTIPLTQSSSSSSTTSTSKETSLTSKLTTMSSSQSSSTIGSTVTVTTESIKTSSTSSLTTPVTTTTTTNASTTLRTIIMDDGKWKTILAITIPLTAVAIIAAGTSIFIVKRWKKKNSKESFEMLTGFENLLARK
ncbi:unnamed protein product [Adineta steineri]|uniref:Uncharacterized protein n=1 Tax=Adineta steineri TaxID=433720 RepID=A0A818JWX6_9BILA|nr:unnamed protein product [Adineta steineri]